MAQHPIESLMSTSMESIREMVDVNTVVGDPVKTQDGSTIIPISRVSFGFVAGGGEYAGGIAHPQTDSLPFAGGAGAGVSLQPVRMRNVLRRSIIRNRFMSSPPMVFLLL